MNQISDLFYKDIHRNINGVIKVGQQDRDNIRQELEEYVITKELDRHFQTFFERYVEALNTPTDKMGVWISGFFGSGKSHFLKILSYLLQNVDLGDTRALDYFDSDRVRDSLLRANIAKAARSQADVILFNIDSKAEADSKNQKDSIVKVFQKVFDEHLGYFGTVPAIAEFERQLDEKGKYGDFQTAFQDIHGTPWVENRDAWAFCQDEIGKALQTSLEISADAASKLMDLSERNYTLSIEKFARTVKTYLDRKGKNHYLIFMVDEVGQYIGDNSDLMLNLQTVVEDLGVNAQGRAWVVVTSQEAIDKITKNRIKGKDFSKIVGRFGRPLSLSSANTDEVIKLRLLRKTDAAQQSLAALYQQKTAILKNQITFTSDCANLPSYRDDKDFVSAYPFIPYQFNLLQNVFTQIRLMGATGKHLSEGERSLLDGFQIASQAVDREDLGALVPVHICYRAVEGFLDGNIKRVIEQAENNPNLQPFDINLLQTLFMIKYVKEVRANLDNLTTLSLDNIDRDKLALREQIEESLRRLTKETLIQRNGEIYYFLTHEEQDIGREIKNTEIEPSDITKKLQALVWEMIFPDKKFRYDKRHEYNFNRQLDDQTYGQQTHDIGLHIITPYCDRYALLQEESQCLMETSAGKAVLVRLPDEGNLLDELNELVQTSTYISNKNSGILPQTVQTILATRSDENSRRQERIRETLEDLITRGDVFACGNRFKEVTRSDSKTLLTEGLKYLVDTLYTKLTYVESGFESEQDITHALLKDYQEQDTSGKVYNSAAHSEMLAFLTDEKRAHRQVTIRNAIDKFNGRPWGWSELDTLGVMAELFNLGKVELRHAGGTVNFRESGLVTRLRSRKGLNEYTIRLGDVINTGSLKVAKDLASDLLPESPSSDPLKLFETYQKALQDQKSELEGWQGQIKDEKLPFGDLVETSLETLTQLLKVEDAAAFFDRFKQCREVLEDYIEDRETLRGFFIGPLKLYRQARENLRSLEPELRHLQEGALLQNVESVRQILAMKNPTAKIPQLPMLPTREGQSAGSFR
ncbi:BREX system P-loop protein BrxC [Spirulina sp. 06S082]|uniref:BREX system P-loop protein BrxC n=1 Tax=Spirulina sp. 06S082 TaxID=3110248 RepID=UPI002B21B466|nr:BREX system P-loop protein BrxC [Spirulina sp. 06S082]MEA5469929.1 BREX system P-loop protein BrxC [Spirulina sp. 06S082]